MSRGYVYILSNPSMPGIIKIGKTTRSVEQRCLELYQTGVPMPFNIVHSVLSPDCSALEAEMHRRFSDERIAGGREFFRVSPHDAMDALDFEHKELLLVWLNDFMPNHEIIATDLSVCTSFIAKMASDLEVMETEVVTSIRHLLPEHIQFGLDREAERIVEWRSAKVSKLVAVSG